MPTSRALPHTAVVGSRLYVLGGRDGSRAMRSLECLDPERGTWEVLPPMSEPRVFAASAVVAGNVYVAGGLSEQGETHSAERYSPRARAWQPLPHMAQPRAFGTAAPMAEGRLLVCGGIGSCGFDQSAECFVPAEAAGVGPGVWKSLLPMRWTAVLAARAQDAGGNVYLCGGASLRCAAPDLARTILQGGWPSRGARRLAQRFRAASEIWEHLPPMRLDRCGATAAAVGSGGICVCGGFSPTLDALESSELFDPTSASWCFLPAMRKRRSIAASCAFGGRLFVFGGRTAFECRSAECFDFASGSWELLPDLSTPRRWALVDLL
mmetsp:Transcript_36299/g.113084  ORF Transcript_36299/g.113084 Transcript_36299/m.113084 type:complete len:323 (+) Transcript_36299:146-1114(+)